MGKCVSNPFMTKPTIDPTHPIATLANWWENFAK